jgi:hypothetical protein
MHRALLTAFATLGLAGPAQAAGVTTHAFMDESAISMVSDPRLAALLEANTDALLSGGSYPDGGYASGSFPGGAYGEDSHWQRFIDAYVQEIRSRADCPDLTDPAGPCAKVVAHMLGAAGHGMGDELWDWLFEPAMADHDESPTHPVFRTDAPGFAELASTTPFDLINTSEYVMDIIALVEGGRLAKAGTFVPPTDDLLAAYSAIRRDDITREGIFAGHSLITAAQLGERSGLGEEYARVKLTMPWSSSHMLTAPGGVYYNARAIAAYYDAIWHTLLTGEHGPLRVGNVAPLNGSTGLTTDFQPAQIAPGPRGGGSTKRILATFSAAIDPQTVNPDTFLLYDEAGDPVAPMGGFPRMGPYGPDAGEHTMLFYPAEDLAPCATYTAEVTAGVRDWFGKRLTHPLQWSFETAC